jgi:DNA-binding response OmpR family regulator
MPSRRAILLVEDDVELRSMFRVALTAEGFHVRGAGTGMEAIARIEADPPDLIILDLGLPDIDGYTVLDELKADPRRNAIPVMVVTGRTLLPLFPVACLVRKPIAPDDLVRLVRNCLAQHPQPGLPNKAVVPKSSHAC